MKQLLEIHVDGREILGRPHDLSKPWGLFVKKNGFQGWEGLPAGRREALARAVEHGEHDLPVYLPARVVTIDGLALPLTLHYCRNSATGSPDSARPATVSPSRSTTAGPPGGLWPGGRQRR
ncbi:hypothetical protein JM654_03825 [Microbacterium oxydans]|nr:hypothetical protein [Microbacterium oxydans]